jgi:hypothetical protein
VTCKVRVFLVHLSCGQGAGFNSRPDANFSVSGKKFNAAKHNSVYTLKEFYFKINRAFALKD